MNARFLCLKSVSVASLSLFVTVACTATTPPTPEVLIQTVEVEVTRVVEITSTPEPSPTPAPLAPIVFQEDFESGPGEWELPSETDGGSASITDGRLVMTDEKPQWIVWFGHPEIDYLNAPFDLSVAATYISGPRGAAAGIQFRYLDNDNQLQFMVDGNSFMALALRIDGVYSELIPWTKCASIGRGTNLLRLIDFGNRIVAYSNGDLLFDIPFDSLRPGGLGFTVVTWDDANAAWAFDDVVVRDVAR